MTVGHVAHCHAHVVTDAAGHALATKQPPVSGYGPSDLRSAYKVTGSGSSSTIIAIVDAYGYTNAERDLGTYRTQFGLPACTTANGCFKKLNQNGVQGSYPAQNTGWAQESALDLDMASAMCPSCKIYLIEATTASYSNLATAENTAASKGAHAISNSYGGGEAGTTGYESAYNHAGIAITVSSGDSGYGVEFPASSPHVTAVGGTHLVRDGSSRGWNETVWSGAGSGCSTVYAKPSWQHDASCSKRTVADVSAVADPNTGVAVYGPVSATRSGWLVFGGTSVAAPLIAGVYGVNGGSVNYGSNPYSNTGALFDVTSGSNGSCGGSYLCTGKVGYDGPSGLGTPNGVAAF
jgi:subtilase family serine protease